MNLCGCTPGIRAPPQAVYAEHGVEVLQEHQPRMEAPGKAPALPRNFSEFSRGFSSFRLHQRWAFYNFHFILVGAEVGGQ